MTASTEQNQEQRALMPHPATGRRSTLSRNRRVWGVASLAATVVMAWVTSRACDTTSEAPQQITNDAARLSYQVSTTWRPTAIDLPFGPGPAWSGVAGTNLYTCGDEQLNRALLGSTTYTGHVSATTALTTAATSLITTALGLNPPPQLPHPTPATLGNLPAQHLRITLHPTRPHCPTLTTTLDLYATSATTNNSRSLSSEPQWSLFFLIADQSGGPTTPSPLNPAQQRHILRTVRLIPH